MMKNEEACHQQLVSTIFKNNTQKWWRQNEKHGWKTPCVQHRIWTASKSSHLRRSWGNKPTQLLMMQNVLWPCDSKGWIPNYPCNQVTRICDCNVITETKRAGMINLLVDFVIIWFNDQFIVIKVIFQANIVKQCQIFSDWFLISCFILYYHCKLHVFVFFDFWLNQNKSELNVKFRPVTLFSFDSS